MPARSSRTCCRLILAVCSRCHGIQVKDAITILKAALSGRKRSSFTVNKDTSSKSVDYRCSRTERRLAAPCLNAGDRVINSEGLIKAAPPVNPGRTVTEAGNSIAGQGGCQLAKNRRQAMNRFVDRPVFAAVISIVSGCRPDLYPILLDCTVS